jgi:RNA polymerase sigma factor (sigma-70 family)
MNHLHCNIYSRDEDFIRDIKAGGHKAETATSCLYLRYRKRVFTYFNHLIKRHGEFKALADDLVHDSFIVMLDKIRQEYQPVHSLAGFWIGIGKHLFLNQLKKDQRTVLVNDPEAIYESREAAYLWIMADDQEDEQLENAIAKLCQRCRDILLLWIDRYTMTEITQIMKLSNVAMARKTKYECFKKLKEIVKAGHIPGM